MKPWERYRSAEKSAGPWTKYGEATQQDEPAAPSSGPPRRPVLPRRQTMGKGEAALYGAGRFLEDVADGASQLMGVYAGLKGAGNADKAADEKRQQIAAREYKESAVMKQPGASAGYFGAALVPAVASSFVPGLNTIPGAALTGGVLGALQPTTIDGERTGNILLNAGAGAAGQGFASLLGRIAQPVKRALSPDEAAAVSLLESQGVPLTVGQRSGSPVVQRVERFLADNPVTSAAMQEAGDRQSRAYTAAALRTVGETADSAGPTVLNSAKTRITGTLDAIENRYSADVNTVLTELADLADVATRNEAGPILKHIDRVIRSADANGKIPGDLVAKMRTEIAPLRSHPVMGGLANDLEEILRNGLQQAMQGTDDFAKYAQARNQYRNLKSIDSAVDTTARGQVKPATLASRQNSSKYTKKSFRYGVGDQELANLARAGSTVVDRFPNSGTAARAGMQLLPAGLGALYGASQGGDLAEAAKYAALGYLAPRGAVSLLTNPFTARYLANGLTGVPRGLLQSAGRLPLGPAAAAGLLTQQ